MAQNSQPSALEVQTALLKANYFPNHLHDGTELPPTFTTKQLTNEVLNEICSPEFSAAATRDEVAGFDAVAYRLTRFNLLHRHLGIPHPLAHLRLTQQIVSHWDSISYVSRSPNSQFRIALHADGRISSMKYDSPQKEKVDYASMFITTNEPVDENWSDVHAIHARGKRFRVVTDITNFHPSIYTHAVSWAAVGLSMAKSARNDHSKWFNQLDHAIRSCKRNETVGLWTGPGTSTIVSEMILARVDEALGTDHLRYLDDYIHYTYTYDEAEAFLNHLAHQLTEYGLHLNPSKTAIEQLPVPVRPAWLRSLYRGQPNALARTQTILDYLDDALELAKESLQESAMKFAVRRLVESITSRSVAEQCFDRLLSLCAFFPNIAAPVAKLAEEHNIDLSTRSEQVGNILRTYVGGRFSDGLGWMLHLAQRKKLTLDKETQRQILESGDICAITLLCIAWPAAVHEAVSILQDDEADPYLIDSQWIFWYEMYRIGHITENPYRRFRKEQSKPTERELCLDILRDKSIGFVQL